MTSRFPTPAEMAAWPEPNYVDPETYRPLVLAVDIPMTVIVISFVAMRFYSRTVLIFAIGFDDWLMLFAAVRMASFHHCRHGWFRADSTRFSP